MDPYRITWQQPFGKTAFFIQQLEDMFHFFSLLRIKFICFIFFNDKYFKFYFCQ